MLPKLKQDFIHLECSRQRLNENSRPDSPMGNVNVRLRKVEDVVPKASFTVVLHFREIEVRAGSAGDELFGVVVEIECEVKNRSGDRGVVHSDTRLIQVPTTGSIASR